MPKYPKELVTLAREHYNFTTKSARLIRTDLMTICIAESAHHPMGARKPPKLEMYTAREIAEIIKDIDRNG